MDYQEQDIHIFREAVEVVAGRRIQTSKDFDFLSDTCEVLRLSPIFNLSMASKELFHSNMLYWISLTYRKLFLSILDGLDVKTNEWPDNWKSHREKSHFDLLITSENEKEILFVLENKVKSIPHTDQLDKYKNKVSSTNARLMLLSLATNLPNQKIIKDNGWIIKNYKDLALAIISILPQITSNYHILLLEDYCKCILSLHEKQHSWNYKGDESYYKQFVEEAEEEKSLRIEDMRKKVLYSRLAADLQKELHAKIYTNNQIVNDKEESPGCVYVNYGMTHSMGLVDIKIRIRDNLMLVIQLQGMAYKHCIETLDKEGLDFVKNVGFTLNNKTNKNICIPDLVRNIADCFFSPLEKGADISAYPFKEGFIDFPKSHKSKVFSYNKYGETFIYQYVILAEKLTINDIIYAIIEDIRMVTSHILKKQIK